MTDRNIFVYIETAGGEPVKVGLEMLTPAREAAGGGTVTAVIIDGQADHEFGSVILEKANILMGVGIVENAYDETALIEGLLPSEIEEREPELLKTAADRMPKLYFDRCELLIVDRIGKNISGTGMDPNISGAFGTPYASGGIEAQRRCILDLTDETHGGAYGMIICARLRPACPKPQIAVLVFIADLHSAINDMPIIDKSQYLTNVTKCVRLFLLRLTA